MNEKDKVSNNIEEIGISICKSILSTGGFYLQSYN